MPLAPIKGTALPDLPGIPCKPSNQARSTSLCGASLNLSVVEILGKRITPRWGSRFYTFFFGTPEREAEHGRAPVRHAGASG
jgi:hypothetical protein